MENRWLLELITFDEASCTPILLCIEANYNSSKIARRGEIDFLGRHSARC